MSANTYIKNNDNKYNNSLYLTYFKYDLHKLLAFSWKLMLLSLSKHHEMSFGSSVSVSRD